MTATASQNKLGKLIHVAHIQQAEKVYLYLRKVEDQKYAWYKENNQGAEEETSVSGINIEEAIRKANKHWKNEYIGMLNCGFRYSLPERDEHGINALFYEMILGYTSSNGIFFDTDYGSNFFINFASKEALNLWKTLQKQGRI